VTLITYRYTSLMKDHTTLFLSTVCANKLVKKRRSTGFYWRVKAVNETSSPSFYQLSHFSVDNMV